MDPFYFLDFESNLKDVHDNPFSLHELIMFFQVIHGTSIVMTMDSVLYNSKEYTEIFLIAFYKTTYL